MTPARHAGGGDGGLTTTKREELSRLRRENRQVRLEREILAAAGHRAISRKSKKSNFGKIRPDRPSIQVFNSWGFRPATIR
jgi:transposase-like protein